MKKRDINIISRFMNITEPKTIDWNFVMEIVEKIEGITQTKVSISSCIEFSWWYSKSKVTEFKTFTEPRTPFDSISGNFYNRRPDKTDTDGASKIEQVLNLCIKWIKWYNKAVLKA